MAEDERKLGLSFLFPSRSDGVIFDCDVAMFDSCEECRADAMKLMNEVVALWPPPQGTTLEICERDTPNPVDRASWDEGTEPYPVTVPAVSVLCKGSSADYERTIKQEIHNLRKIRKGVSRQR